MNPLITCQANTEGDIGEPYSIYLVTAKRASRTGKPQIVSYEEVGGIRYVERLHPIIFNPDGVPRSQRSWREREQAERFLHDMICSPGEWWRIADEFERIDAEGLRTGRWRIADLNPGEDVAAHDPDNCPCFTWRTLAKECLWLSDQLAAAAGQCPLIAKVLPWPGCFLVAENRQRSRRGRPSLKGVFYELAAEFVALARLEGDAVPRGFYKTLALYLSFPWYGITFTAGELRKAVCEWYTRSPGVSPAGRVFSLSDLPRIS